MMDAFRCNICLNFTHSALKKLGDFGLDNIKYVAKLTGIVPEIEWLEHYDICQDCIAQLVIVHAFRTSCIQRDEERQRLSAIKRETSEDDGGDNDDNDKLVEVPEPEPFTCYHCRGEFEDKAVLADHLLKEHRPKQERRPKKHKCGKCGRSYTLEKVMQAHLVTCNGVKRQSRECSKNFTCEICGKAYTSQKILKAHRCPTENVPSKRTRSFTCEVCMIPMNFAKSIVEHCVRDHGMVAKCVKPYTCDECPNRFSNSANLIQHKKYHSGNRSHICSFCGKTYKTKSDLTVHEYTHFNRRNYACDMCDKAFNTNKNLRSHKLVVHTDSSKWKYECNFCMKRFPLKSGYEQHLKRHAGDKRFCCHICEKLFISRSELIKHMGYHSKVKAFRCDHCDKSYKDKKVFNIHLAKAHGIGDAKVPIRVRKFACHMCPMSFFDKQKLSRHLCTHTGEKPFPCDFCDKGFTDKYYLKQHLRRAHSIGETAQSDDPLGNLDGNLPIHVVNVTKPEVGDFNLEF